ncbi:MAG TPA: MBL fold metallo-hydrolase [Spirochaetales bacterium]|nr:MBL fold metallo-hydrolase [Spirochaetales bacterium]HRY53763.1 MBL fold metallo-hydrolase [Spirochaetia bacterium]HRZ65592.1 MBL fold metallo-hydrolase [Spirochaetia bacterium]
MAEARFERLAGRTFVARGPSNVGLYDLGGGRALLVDSGNDEEAGKRLARGCEAAGFSVALVANTHSHADHCGGNAYLQSRTGCGIAAPRHEAAFIERPLLEPSLLWGGYPPPPLRNKFLMAKASRVTMLLDPPCALGDTGVEAIPLPGHFLAMAGYRSPDSVFFIADAVASPEILEKHCVFFLYDVEAQLASLDALEAAEADWFVPSHAPPTEDIRPLVGYMRLKIEAVSSFLAEACGRPSSPEELLVALAGRFEVELNHTQYVLLDATMRSTLAYLAGRKEIASRLEGGRLLFERT